MEGVMMRGQRYMAVAVRAPSSEIVLRSEELPKRLYQSRITRIPFLRGSLMLWDTLGLGMRALMFSADVAMGEEDVKLSKPVAWTTAAIGIILGIGLFFVLPVVLTAFVHERVGNSLFANVGMGLYREGSATRHSTARSYGGGLGFRHVVRERHGALRAEVRADHLDSDAGSGRPSLTTLELRLGFDLWL